MVSFNEESKLNKSGMKIRMDDWALSLKKPAEIMHVNCRSDISALNKWKKI